MCTYMCIMDTLAMQLTIRIIAVLLSLNGLIAVGIQEDHMFVYHGVVIVESPTTFDKNARTRLTCASLCMQNDNCVALSFQNRTCRIETTSNLSVIPNVGAVTMTYSKGLTLQQDFIVTNSQSNQTSLHGQDRPSNAWSLTSTYTTNHQSMTTMQFSESTTQKDVVTIDLSWPNTTTINTSLVGTSLRDPSTSNRSMTTTTNTTSTNLTTQDDVTMDTASTEPEIDLIHQSTISVTGFVSTDQSSTQSTALDTVPTDISSIETTTRNFVSMNTSSEETSTRECVITDTSQTNTTSHGQFTTDTLPTDMTYRDHVTPNTSPTDATSRGQVTADTLPTDAADPDYGATDTSTTDTASCGHVTTDSSQTDATPHGHVTTETSLTDATSRDHVNTETKSTDTTTHTLLFHTTDQESVLSTKGTTTHVNRWPNATTDYMFLGTLLLPMFEAKAYCSDIGGKLLEIETAEKDQFLQDNLLNSVSYFYWIGGYDYNKDGTFSWQSNPTEPIVYSNWNTGEPRRTGSLLCLRGGVQWGFKWASSLCTEEYPFFCEKLP